MTLEQAIEYVKNLCIERSEDVECNECKAKHSDILGYLLELHAWRENPFSQMKEHCEASGKCVQCDWFNRGCHYLNTIPEDFKL